MRLTSTATAVAIQPPERKPPFSSPAIAGPRRTRIDLVFIFTSKNRTNEVYLAVYKGEVNEAIDNNNARIPLVKLSVITKGMLETITYENLMQTLGTGLEQKVANIQMKAIEKNIIFIYSIEDVSINDNGIKSDNGRLKPEFVEALFNRNQAALDEVVKSRDIDL